MTPLSPVTPTGSLLPVRGPLNVVSPGAAISSFQPRPATLRRAAAKFLAVDVDVAAVDAGRFLAIIAVVGVAAALVFAPVIAAVVTMGVLDAGDPVQWHTPPLSDLWLFAVGGNALLTLVLAAKVWRTSQTPPEDWRGLA